MSKPLVLTIYPWVDRWVDYTMEFLGKQVSGSSREMGYETPRGVFRGDEWPEKRLTEAELAAEWHRSAAVTGIHGPHAEGNRTAIIHRFATLPHYDQEQS